MEQAPGNLIYRSSDKAYFATSIFKNQFTSGIIDEWMALDSSLCEYVDKPQFEIKPELTRPLIQAIHKGTGVTVMYRSMEHPSGTERSLFPHTLVYSGFRWHVRAWCEKNAAYRDFVLSRFRGIPDIMEESEHGVDDDTDWNQMVIVRIAPDPRLNLEQREVVETDYGMEGGVLEVSTRARLVTYVLQLLHIEPNALAGDPTAQQIVVENRDELTPWLFG